VRGTRWVLGFKYVHTTLVFTPAGRSGYCVHYAPKRSGDRGRETPMRIFCRAAKRAWSNLHDGPCLARSNLQPLHALGPQPFGAGSTPPTLHTPCGMAPFPFAFAPQKFLLKTHFVRIMPFFSHKCTCLHTCHSTPAHGVDHPTPWHDTHTLTQHIHHAPPHSQEGSPPNHGLKGGPRWLGCLVLAANPKPLAWG
jgi:hypothetical protein